MTKRLQIETSMTVEEAQKWVNALAKAEAELEAVTQERDNAKAIYQDQSRELRLVIQERDNALLRIEELERQIPDHRDYWGQWIKGGVHPNA